MAGLTRGRGKKAVPSKAVVSVTRSADGKGVSMTIETTTGTTRIFVPRGSLDLPPPPASQTKQVLVPEGRPPSTG